VLVIGGYGGFGGHLSRRLAERGADVVVAGRNLVRAETYCRENPGCRPACADRNAGIADLLDAERPDVVVDASGPFQSADYRIVEDCIEAGVNYIDLADARDFVTGICRYDSAARQAGIAVISGASSVPALSGAVARKLAEGLDRVTSVEIAISASSRATVGPSVAAAILGGIGRPIPSCADRVGSSVTAGKNCAVSVLGSSARAGSRWLTFRTWRCFRSGCLADRRSPSARVPNRLWPTASCGWQAGRYGGAGSNRYSRCRQYS
jgi:hypothetical protein